MMLIAAALAPRPAKNGPLMLAAPSYVTSANRLTTPIVNTKANAVEPLRAKALFMESPTDAGTFEWPCERWGRANRSPPARNHRARAPAYGIVRDDSRSASVLRLVQNA